MTESSLHAVATETLWDFSLRVYGIPGVAERCLRLQDRDGVDVNLLLFSAWAAGRRPALPSATLERAIALAGEWNEAVIAPLRGVRRGMKTSPPTGREGADIAALRERIQGAELEGERLLQAALAPLAPVGEPPGGRAIAVAAGNALRLLRLQGITLGESTLVDLRDVLLAAWAAEPHLLGELVAAPVVVTVDDDRRENGTMRRLDAHLPPAVRHLAVSVLVLSGPGRWLLQRRVEEKCAFGGYWANSCCTHPLPDEPPIETARRRAREELGLELARIEPAGSFTYTAVDETTGFVESEHDHVFVGFVDGEPEPTVDPLEIAETAWLDPDEARTWAEKPLAAPWYRDVAELASRALSGTS